MACRRGVGRPRRGGVDARVARLGRAWAGERRLRSAERAQLLEQSAMTGAEAGATTCFAGAGWPDLRRNRRSAASRPEMRGSTTAARKRRKDLRRKCAKAILRGRLRECRGHGNSPAIPCGTQIDFRGRHDAASEGVLPRPLRLRGVVGSCQGTWERIVSVSACSGSSATTSATIGNAPAWPRRWRSAGPGSRRVSLRSRPRARRSVGWQRASSASSTWPRIPCGPTLSARGAAGVRSRRGPNRLARGAATRSCETCSPPQVGRWMSAASDRRTCEIRLCERGTMKGAESRTPLRATALSPPCAPPKPWTRRRMCAARFSPRASNVRLNLQRLVTGIRVGKGRKCRTWSTR